MRAVILCAGYATRLYPLTSDQPKALLSIGGRPLASYLFDRLAELAELVSVAVVTNQKFKDHFFRWRETLAFPKPVEILVDPSRSDADKLGAIRDLELAVSHFGIQEDLLVLAGDNLFDFELAGFVEKSLAKKPAVTIGLVRLDDPEQSKRYGMVKVDSGNRVVEFREKPGKGEGGLVSVGIYFLPGEKIRMLQDYLATEGNPDAPGHFFRWVSEREAVYSYLFHGKWYDVGDIASYEEANQRFQP